MYLMHDVSYKKGCSSESLQKQEAEEAGLRSHSREAEAILLVAPPTYMYEKNLFHASIIYNLQSVLHSLSILMFINIISSHLMECKSMFCYEPYL